MGKPKSSNFFVIPSIFRKKTWKINSFDWAMASMAVLKQPKNPCRNNQSASKNPLMTDAL